MDILFDRQRAVDTCALGGPVAKDNRGTNLSLIEYESGSIDGGPPNKNVTLVNWRDRTNYRGQVISLDKMGRVTYSMHC